MIATAFVSSPVNGHPAAQAVVPAVPAVVPARPAVVPARPAVVPAAKAPAVKPVGANGAKPAAPAVKPDPVPVPAPAPGQKIKTGR